MAGLFIALLVEKCTASQSHWKSGQCKTQTAECGPGVKCRLSVKCRLQTQSKTQAGLQNAEWGLQTRGKMQTEILRRHWGKMRETTSRKQWGSLEPRVCVSCVARVTLVKQDGLRDWQGTHVSALCQLSILDVRRLPSWRMTICRYIFELNVHIPSFYWFTAYSVHPGVYISRFCCSLRCT